MNYQDSRVIVLEKKQEFVVAKNHVLMFYDMLSLQLIDTFELPLFVDADQVLGMAASED